MISVNGEKLNITYFPDHTLALRYITTINPCRITWKYDNEGECMIIMYLVKHLKSKGINDIILRLPYVPNARMDRVKNDDEIFTLKYFAEFLNSLEFKEVWVLDPHSDVCTALINNCYQMKVIYFISYAIEHATQDDGDFIVCYPDQGAKKRYNDMVSTQYEMLNSVSFLKNREWRPAETGSSKIISSTLLEPEKVKGQNVLIIDDICSRGDTFSHAAESLKDAGAEDIMLYCTHCEDKILDGKILESDTISRVYTTDSILRIEHPKIHVCTI